MSPHQKGCAPNAPFDLATLIFSAKIDYLTVHTGGKKTLPPLDGTPKWAKREGWQKLSIHDPSPRDLVALVESVGSLRLAELEICVDIRCGPGIAKEARLETLKKIMVEMFARRLDPSSGPGLLAEFRAFYRHFGQKGIVRPFNLKLPLPTDQQLHGGRGDFAQVKAYLKRIDQGNSIAESEYSARVEVRLSGDGLHMHGLVLLSDLDGFKFRHRLISYFRHFRGTRASRSRRNRVSGYPYEALAAKQDDDDQAEWARIGIGAFSGGGKRAHVAPRRLRDTRVNKRIGQALTRLENAYRITKSVRGADGDAH